MILGKVVGTVWGRKEAQYLSQAKLLVVRPVGFPPNRGTIEIQADHREPELETSIIIAVDKLGAGVGEYVLVGHGSRIRDLTVGKNVPTKEVILAIVDKAVVHTQLYQDKQP